MPRTIQCAYLKREAEGLDYATYPGELGKRIYASISKEAWAAWLKHQTMLVNENRLNLADQRARGNHRNDQRGQLHHRSHDGEVQRHHGQRNGQFDDQDHGQ